MRLYLIIILPGFLSGCSVCYPDADADGFGDMTTSAVLCGDLPSTEGYATNNDDCNDSDPAVNPDATEACDGVDNDCDGNTDEAPTALATSAPLYDPAIILASWDMTEASSSDVATLCGEVVDTVLLYNSVGDLLATYSDPDTALTDLSADLNGTFATDVATGALIYLCPGSYVGFILEEFSPPITIAGVAGESFISNTDGSGVRLVTGSYAYLTNLIVSDNETDPSEPRGGGLKIKDYTGLVVQDSVISNNYASDFGGGAHLNGIDAYFFGITVSGNELETGSGHKGAGLYLRAVDGGNEINLYLQDSQIYSQIGVANDGGIYLRGDDGPAALTVVNSWFCNPEVDDIVVMEPDYDEVIFNLSGVVDGECIADGSTAECTF